MIFQPPQCASAIAGIDIDTETSACFARASSDVCRSKHERVGETGSGKGKRDEQDSRSAGIT